jgi:hypothetical protein
MMDRQILALSTAGPLFSFIEHFVTIYRFGRIDDQGFRGTAV